MVDPDKPAKVLSFYNFDSWRGHDFEAASYRIWDAEQDDLELSMSGRSEDFPSEIDARYAKQWDVLQQQERSPGIAQWWQEFVGESAYKAINEPLPAAMTTEAAQRLRQQITEAQAEHFAWLDNPESSLMTAYKNDQETKANDRIAAIDTILDRRAALHEESLDRLDLVRAPVAFDMHQHIRDGGYKGREGVSQETEGRIEDARETGRGGRDR